MTLNLPFTQQWLSTDISTEEKFHKPHPFKKYHSLPLFQLLEASPTVPEGILLWGEKIRKTFKTILILGTGGSSLGGQTLCALSKTNPELSLHFIDNVDPDTFLPYFTEGNPREIFILTISKSGTTLETLMQLITAFHLLENFSFHPSQQCLFITEPKESPLTQLAHFYDIPILDHPPIGGRYACFTAVGLLPAAIVGLDPQAFLRGASHTYHYGQDMAWEAGKRIYAYYQSGKSLSVIMPYCDRLRFFSRWYAQMWAESLGKQKKGFTPIIASGTMDQHSQLQLYLDGPHDKLYTFITVDPLENGPVLTAKTLSNFLHPLPLLLDKSLGDVLAVEAWATMTCLHQSFQPVRHFHISTLEAFSLGSLLSYFMLETIAVSYLLDVNPFDQPAVELGKKLVYDALNHPLSL